MPVKTERRLKAEVQEIVTGYICNACDKDMTPEDPWSNPDCHVIRLSGFFGSTFPADMDHMSFVVCSSCLAKWTDTFKIPVDIEGWDSRNLCEVEIKDESTTLWWWQDEDHLYHTEEEARNGQEQEIDDTMFLSLPQTERPFTSVYQTTEGTVEVVGFAFLKDPAGKWEGFILTRHLPDDGRILGWRRSQWNSSNAILLDTSLLS